MVLSSHLVVTYGLQGLEVELKVLDLLISEEIPDKDNPEAFKLQLSF